jgi:hypothetical protein
MSKLTIVLLVMSVGWSAIVFRLAYRAQWNWGLALAVSVPPLAFTFLFGIVGFIIGLLYVGAMWRVLS